MANFKSWIASVFFLKVFVAKSYIILKAIAGKTKALPTVTTVSGDREFIIFSTMLVLLFLQLLNLHHPLQCPGLS